jgi:ubiquitin-like domain-containing CTD phosphatase 1
LKIDDTTKIADLDLRVGKPLMMVGSREEDIASVSEKPEDLEEIINDLDENLDREAEAFEKKEVYLAKIRRRVNEYKIEVFNQPRENKKLLVLDIDYTLFDHRSPAETGVELMRPFLHEFLTASYEHYDIVIWSATSYKWIVEKMKLLGVHNNENYKIAFYLDYNAMITVHHDKRGVVNIKPLKVIWDKFPQHYSTLNTIHFDDIRRNFLMNPRNGLKIKPFCNAHINRSKDRELLKLATYLKNIAENCDDFSKLNHKKWESYKP